MTGCTAPAIASVATPGGIEFVGRVDEQIKLRGFRIEPGEIERVVMSHPRVAACAVVIRAAHDGDSELVAYVAPDQADDHTDPAPDLAHDLAALLRRELPLYMRPSSITVLASLPLNSNGKIDRRALPDPARGVVDEQREGAEPATPTQRHIAAVWCEVLGATSVGIHDDFFELGGHSLRATQVLSRIQRDLQADVALREVFDHPTIESLAALIDSRTGTTPNIDRIATVRRDGRRRNSEVEGNGAE